MDLLDLSLPLPRRLRALHVIKDAIPACGAEERAAYLEQLVAAFPTTDSVLFKHEIAFTLGQIGSVEALPHLYRWLADESEDVVTRHECAEAIGAIGHPDSAAVLERFRGSPLPELAETVHLALRRLAWLQSGGVPEAGAFSSVDPAPPSASKSVAELRDTLLDGNADLYERYRAMFALRDLNSDDSVMALCQGLKDPQSALFRHEIAYVLGQLEHPKSVPPLVECLTDAAEHPMVRHEAAEALGGIAKGECLEALRTFMNDKEPLVGESCQVGIDMFEYWSQWQPKEDTPDAVPAC